jgi:hypothetical protein
MTWFVFALMVTPHTARFEIPVEELLDKTINS